MALLYSSPFPNGRMALLYISSSFSSFLPSTCLTSLTSHHHLCGLTFVHPFINVVGPLYIIIKKKMNPILLFRSSYSSKPISLCWLLNTCPTSSFNELSKRVGWTCGCRHPTVDSCSRNTFSNMIQCLTYWISGFVGKVLYEYRITFYETKGRKKKVLDFDKLEYYKEVLDFCNIEYCITFLIEQIPDQQCYTSDSFRNSSSLNSSTI